jgi:hypothetical protein
MPPALDSGYALSMPLYLAEVLPDDRFSIRSAILGTCFSIGGHYMMTAGHVIHSLTPADGSIAIVGLWDPGQTGFKSARVTDREILPRDIGVLAVDFVYPESAHWFHRLRWNEQTLIGFDAVRCCGYAYGHHVAGGRQSVVLRCFQGHVVADLNEFELPGTKGDIFPVYELSFPAPRGLSGSPLLNSTGSVLVNGVIIGNSASEMLVYRSREVDQDAGTQTIVERYESLTLGIAVRPAAILPLTSRILGTTIEAHLFAHGLLSR